MKTIHLFTTLMLVAGLALVVGPVPVVYAATITVTSTSGGTGGADCTLRDAITAANTDTVTGGCPAGSGADTIVLASGGTYTLAAVDNNTEGSNGLPSITSEIIINGNGAIIERSSSPGIPDFRIFYVAAEGNLTLNELTVRHGLASDVPYHEGNNGGGIYNRGTMALTASTITNNSAGINGGGIFNRGTVTLTNSAISGNNAAQGGIFNEAGTVTLVDSTVNDNSATDDGGGILTIGGEVMLINSTVSNNSASSVCGGILNHLGAVMLTSSIVSDNSSGILNSGTMMLTNSTVSGNGGSGGIYNFIDGTVTLTNSTISDNGGNGGIRHHSSGTVTLINTIVANQRSGGDCGGDPVTSLGHNLDSDGTCGLGAPGDLTADPRLGPLQDNGGWIETHALLPGSPAIDAGDGSACQDTDQRGEPRPADGDGDGLAICDIGAYETQPAAIPICDTVLDDFDRGYYVKIGPNWRGATNMGNYRIMEDELEVLAGGPIYWKPEAYGAEQSACVTINRIDPKGHHGILLKVQPNRRGRATWKRGVIGVSYSNYEQPRNKVKIETYIPGQGWIDEAVFPYEMQDGDQLAGRALPDGTVEAYVNGVLVGTADAGPFFADKGGSIGLWFLSGNYDGILDDFRGR
jgi:hypothetical protein